MSFFETLGLVYGIETVLIAVSILTLSRKFAFFFTIPVTGMVVAAGAWYVANITEPLLILPHIVWMMGLAAVVYAGGMKLLHKVLREASKSYRTQTKRAP